LVAVVPRGTGELACDQGPARVRAERDDDGVAAEASGLSRKNADFANVSRFADCRAQVPGHGIT
jgi:hypothetical protein